MEFLNNIAYDLLYYGYNFKYFFDNYCQGFSKEKCLNIWNKQKNKISNEF